MDIDDGRGPEPLGPPGTDRPLRAARRCSPRRATAWQGSPRRRRRSSGRRSARRCRERAADGPDRAAQHRLDTRGLQCPCGDRAVELSERHLGPADVAGVGPVQEADPEDLRGEPERRLGSSDVDRGKGDQVPEAVDRPLALVPRPPSQSPNGTASSEASSGSRRPSARAGRMRRTRSTRERWR